MREQKKNLQKENSPKSRFSRENAWNWCLHCSFFFIISPYMLRWDAREVMFLQELKPLPSSVWNEKLALGSKKLSTKCFVPIGALNGANAPQMLQFAYKLTPECDMTLQNFSENLWWNTSQLGLESTEQFMRERYVVEETIFLLHLTDRLREITKRQKTPIFSSFFSLACVMCFLCYFIDHSILSPYENGLKIEGNGMCGVFWTRNELYLKMIFNFNWNYVIKDMIAIAVNCWLLELWNIFYQRFEWKWEKR